MQMICGIIDRAFRRQRNEGAITLAEVGVTKAEVRQLSQHLGLSWWDKPACLSSPSYGEEITVGKLQRVGRAERYLRQMGLKNLRVRSG